MKLTNKQFNEINDFIIKMILENEKFKIMDLIRAIVVTDNYYFIEDINLLINGNDVSFDYDLEKVYDYLFSYHKNELIKWLWLIKDKFLKYTKSYYSDLKCVEINIAINSNQVNVEFVLRKLYWFENDDKDIESKEIDNDFTFEIPNYVLEMIEKAKW